MELSDALRSLMSLFMETINGYGTEDTETIKSKVSNWIASQSRYIKGLFQNLCWESWDKLYKEHQHICKKCGGKIRMISEDNIRKLKCPHCKDIFLSVDIEALWDWFHFPYRDFILWIILINSCCVDVYSMSKIILESQKFSN